MRFFSQHPWAGVASGWDFFSGSLSRSRNPLGFLKSRSRGFFFPKNVEIPGIGMKNSRDPEKSRNIFCIHKSLKNPEKDFNNDSLVGLWHKIATKVKPRPFCSYPPISGSHLCLHGIQPMYWNSTKVEIIAASSVVFSTWDDTPGGIFGLFPLMSSFAVISDFTGLKKLMIKFQFRA